MGKRFDPQNVGPGRGREVVLLTSEFITNQGVFQYLTNFYCLKHIELLRFSAFLHEIGGPKDVL
jgi:hypothetical protein